MTLDIIKAKNGWIIRRTYVNRGSVEDFIFVSLTDLANWIIEENSRETNPKDKT